MDFKRLNKQIPRKKINQVKKQYGLHEHDYLRLMLEVNGFCMICKTKKDLVIDHCHRANMVRGLICQQCNSGLGYFKDNIQFLLSAIQYLVDAYNPK
jgi:Recombination endonuclease VII